MYFDDLDLDSFGRRWYITRTTVGDTTCSLQHQSQAAHGAIIADSAGTGRPSSIAADPAKATTLALVNNGMVTGSY